MTATVELNLSEKPGDKELANAASTPVKEFTDLVGSNGRWQIYILIATVAAGIPVAWNHMGIGFFALPLDYWCAKPTGYNLSSQHWIETALPNTTGDKGMTHSQCEMYDMSANSSEARSRVVPCTAYEFEEGSHRTIVKEWGLVCDKEWMSSMNQMVYMCGFLLNALFSGQLADKYGRHPVILWNVVLAIVSGVAAAFSPYFWMFMGMRFLVAMGQSGASLTIFVLMIEIVGAEHRACFSFIQNFGWHIGYCVLPLLAWFLPDWNHLQIAITLPCLLFVAFYWILPESPRWLLTHGKIDTAIKMLEKVAKINKKDVPDLETQVKKLCCIAEREKELKKNVNVFDLLRTPNLRKKTLNLYFTWIVIAFVYYGLSLNTGELGGNYYLNFFLSGLVEVPATIFCLLVLQRFGRKKPFMFTLFCGGVACIACIFIPQSMYELRLTFAMLGKLMISSSFSIVYVYSAEIYPTVARNVGVGSSSTMARIGSMVAPFMKELGKVTNPAVPMALFAILSFVSGMLVWLLPETNGYPVPETLEEAENFGKSKPKDQDIEPQPN